MSGLSSVLTGSWTGAGVSGWTVLVSSVCGRFANALVAPDVLPDALLALSPELPPPPPPPAPPAGHAPSSTCPLQLSSRALHVSVALGLTAARLSSQSSVVFTAHSVPVVKLSASASMQCVMIVSGQVRSACVMSSPPIAVMFVSSTSYVPLLSLVRVMLSWASGWGMLLRLWLTPFASVGTLLSTPLKFSAVTTLYPIFWSPV